MKKTIKFYQIIGFIITALGGTLLHFLYEWTNSLIIASFSSVNESTWEHMKLLFWPMFIYAIIESFFFKDRSNFWQIKLKGILFGLISIPVIFYTYTGIIGKSINWINIIIFVLAAAIAFIYETKEFMNNKKTDTSSKVSFALLCSFAILFIVFTYSTPEIDLFKDPLTGTYGINN